MICALLGLDVRAEEACNALGLQNHGLYLYVKSRQSIPTLALDSLIAVDVVWSSLVFCSTRLENVDEPLAVSIKHPSPAWHGS